MQRYFFLLFLMLSQAVCAAETQHVSTSGAMLKMVIGLGLVFCQKPHQYRQKALNLHKLTALNNGSIKP